LGNFSARRAFAEYVPIRRPRRGILVLVVVVGLILCHGVYGAAHQVHQAPGATDHRHGAGHAAHGDGSGAVGGHQGAYDEGSFGCVAYAASLVVVSIGAVLCLLRGGPPWDEDNAARLLPVRGPGSVLHPARGPTLPVLQVFRL
jgi:hypothetical protein